MITPGRVPIRDPLGLRNDVITNPQWIKWLTQELAPAIAAVTVGGIPQLTGTRAVRLATSAGLYSTGVLFFETDSGLVYIVNASHQWQYSSGTYSRFQSELAAMALTTLDTGLLVYVTDYEHVLRWNGARFVWGSGERSAYFQDFAIAPDSPGWHLCDGATVSYLKGDGSLDTIDLPDSAGSACYRKLGATYASIITAAVVPVLTMDPYTPTGTNSIPILTMDSYTPQGTNSAPLLTMNSYTPAGAISTPTLTMNSYTPAGTNSVPTFTGAAIALTTAAVAPVGATNAVTQVGGSAVTFTPTGTVTAPTFTGNAATLTGTISTPAFTGTPATLTGTVTAPIFTGTAHVLTGSVSAPVFTGNLAVLTGTIALPGDPVANHQAMEWFRM